MKYVKEYAPLIVSAVLVLAIVLGIVIPRSRGCGGAAKDPEMQAKTYYEYFDTQSTVFSYVGDDAAVFEANCRRIEASLSYYHRLFDIYYEYSGVINLRTLNKMAGKGPVAVDRALIDFLLYAKDVYALTGGRVNIALGSVLSLWHDCREDADDGVYAIPSDAALREASLHTSLDALVIDEQTCTVEITDPLMRLDVGALGKGYAAERVLEQLRDAGVTGYVLNLGGNLCTLGTKPSGEGWLTGITNPDRSSGERFACRIVLSDISCVTSGNYERYYFVGGVRYHHIIDPATLYPAAYFASVSILCPDSALADALSTALFCMSEEEGRALVETLDGVEVLWIYEDGRQSATDGFSRLVLKK